MSNKALREKWRSHAKHARERGVKWLSYEQYAEKVLQAGISPNQIGRTLGSYQLARYTDSGDYTIDSCRFITQTENLIERTINGGTERGASKRRGVTKETDLGAAKIANTLKGRSAQTHEYIARIADKKGQPFALIDPSGELIVGRNLRKFCREMGLDRVSLGRVCRGQYKAYKGWTRALREAA